MSHLRPLSSVGFGCLLLMVTIGSFVWAQPSLPQTKIITWGGNTSIWNRSLSLTAVRMGCSGHEPECLADAARLAHTQDVSKVFLAILFNAAQAENTASTYSRMSLQHPELHEVGFDDFVSQYQRQAGSSSSTSSALVRFATQLKSANPNLYFGITVYMDQLSSTDLDLMALDQGFRNRVDYVHLYPHYRREAETFANAVEKTKAIFPHSKVIAGVYAYDRRDYLPCARGKSTPCSNDEEISLFKESLQERWNLARDGKIDGIEFYPGNFGLEEEWSGWGNARSCDVSRRRECIANTQAMRQIVRETVKPEPAAGGSAKSR